MRAAAPIAPATATRRLRFEGFICSSFSLSRRNERCLDGRVGEDRDWFGPLCCGERECPNARASNGYAGALPDRRRRRSASPPPEEAGGGQRQPHSQWDLRRSVTGVGASVDPVLVDHLERLRPEVAGAADIAVVGGDQEHARDCRSATSDGRAFRGVLGVQRVVRVGE